MARIETHQCPNCGGALGIPEAHDQYFRCSFCGSVVEDSTPQAPTTQLVVARPSIAFDTSQLIAYSAPAPSSRGCGGLIAVLAVIVGVSVTGAVLVGLAAKGDISLPGLTDDGLPVSSITSSAVVVSDDESGPDLALMGTNDDHQTLVYVDFDATEPVRWTADLEAEQASLYDQYLTGPELLYVTVDDRVLAFDRRTGDAAFVVDLEDVVSSTICDDCFRLMGPDRNTLVTLSSDGTLAAWDAATGAKRWSTLLHQATRQVLDMGGNPVVIDQVPGEDPKLFLYDVLTGTVSTTISPRCPGDGFFPDEPLGIYDYLVPIGGGSFVWISTSPIIACAQRWDPLAAGPAWTTSFPDGGTNIPYDREDFVLGEGRLAVAQNAQADVYDLATGAQTVLTVPDEDMRPIGLAEGRLVVSSTSTRGSATSSIIALDLATSGVAWRTEMEGDAFEDYERHFVTSTGWTASVRSGAVDVVQYLDDPDSLVFQRILLATGGAPETSVTPLTDGYDGRPTIFGYTGDSLVLAIGREARVVDAATGAVRQTAP